jgi:hypothetical protein
VDVGPFEAAGELDRGDERDADGIGVRLDLEVGGGVVVVADGDDVETALAREVDHLRGERVPSEW